MPTKIKTIYHTKIIKVPEHHHYIHEKEKPKLIKIPEHHHYFHEKEKEKLVDIHSLQHQDDTSLDLQTALINHHQGFSNEHKDFEFEDGEHNIFKKHAPAHRYKKKSPRHLTYV